MCNEHGALDMNPAPKYYINGTKYINCGTFNAGYLLNEEGLEQVKKNKAYWKGLYENKVGPWLEVHKFNITVPDGSGGLKFKNVDHIDENGNIIWI
jgi:hypothetical protein